MNSMTSTSIRESIDLILQSDPPSVQYENLKSFLETTHQNSPKELQAALDLSYMEKKLVSIADLILFSLLYKRFAAQPQKKTYLYYSSYDNEKVQMNYKLKDYFKQLKEKKTLKTAFFTDVLRRDLPPETLERSRSSIRILYQDLIFPMFSEDDSCKINFPQIGQILLEWGLILPASFEREEILLVIEVMKLAISPKIYQTSSFFYMDYEKLWGVIKTVLKVAAKRPEFAANLQVFFEIIAEDDIRKIIRDVWDPLRGYMTKAEDIVMNGVRKILQVAFTKKTLKFILEIGKNLKKNEDFRLFLRMYEEIVLPLFLDRLKGAFFSEVLEVLKLFIFSFIRLHMMSKEEWERLLSNFSFLAQEASRKAPEGKSKEYKEYGDSSNKIKEYHEFMFALARFYTFIHDRDNKVHTFERKGQIDTFLGRIRRTYGVTEPSQYMLEYNYEKLILSETQIKPFMEKHYNNFQQSMEKVCYLNAFMQSLYATIPFKEQVFRHSNALFPHDSNHLIQSLHKLFDQMKKSAEIGSKEQIDPREFKTTVPEPFRTLVEQQDAMDFGRALLDEMEKKTKDSPLQGLIEELFTCEIAHSYECQTCGNVSQNIDKAVEFSLSFSAESLIKETQEHDFREMMRCYMKDEEFSGSNAYDCAKCGRKTELTIKRSKWQRIPPIFIIRANRFTNTYVNKILHKISIVDEFIPSQVFPPETFAIKKKAEIMKESKELENKLEYIDQEIKVQEENKLQEETKDQEDDSEITEDDLKYSLDNRSPSKDENPNLLEPQNLEIPFEKSPKNQEIKEFSKNNSLEHSWNAKYALYCMIIHKGPTVKEGHYFVFVRDFRDNSWFCLDDSSIEKRDLEYDFSRDETPYIFFYMRRPG